MPVVREMLMLLDREEISRDLVDGLQFKEIAFGLGRDPSVISREVRRHGGREAYRAVHCTVDRSRWLGWTPRTSLPAWR